MSELIGQKGEVRMTIQITRKNTGKVEQFDLVGQITDEQLKGLQNGSNTLNSSEKRSD